MQHYCLLAGQPADLYDKIKAECEDSDTTDGLLCGALKYLRGHRAKPNQQIVLTLMLLAKECPVLFMTDVVTGVSYTSPHTHGFLCVRTLVYDSEAEPQLFPVITFGKLSHMPLTFVWLK